MGCVSGLRDLSSHWLEDFVLGSKHAWNHFKSTQIHQPSLWFILNPHVYSIQIWIFQGKIPTLLCDLADSATHQCWIHWLHLDGTLWMFGRSNHMFQLQNAGSMKIHTWVFSNHSWMVGHPNSSELQYKGYDISHDMYLSLIFYHLPSRCKGIAVLTTYPDTPFTKNTCPISLCKFTAPKKEKNKTCVWYVWVWYGDSEVLCHLSLILYTIGSTNLNADTYVEEQRQYSFLTFSSEPTCETPWVDTLRWHSCRAPLLDTIAQRSGKTLLLDTLIWHSRVTLL